MFIVVNLRRLEMNSTQHGTAVIFSVVLRFFIKQNNLIPKQMHTKMLIAQYLQKIAFLEVGIVICKI